MPHADEADALIVDAVRAADADPRRRGATNEELEQATGLKPGTVSGQVTHLKRKRVLFDTGKHRPTSTGAPAAIVTADPIRAFARPRQQGLIASVSSLAWVLLASVLGA